MKTIETAKGISKKKKAKCQKDTKNSCVATTQE